MEALKSCVEAAVYFGCSLPPPLDACVATQKRFVDFEFLRMKSYLSEKDRYLHPNGDSIRRHGVSVVFFD